MSDQKHLDHLLRAANPVPSGFADSDDSTELLDQIGAQITATERPLALSGRRRFALPNARRGVVLASAIGLLAAGGAAAATTIILTSNTVGAPSFCQTELKNAANVPFPSGDQAWKNWALLQSVGPKLGVTLHELCDTPAGAHVADGGYPGSFVIPTVYQKVRFTTAAFCAWSDRWLSARADGDAATESQAASEIAGAQQWPSTREIQKSGSGVGAKQLAWFVLVQEAVRADDVSVVASAFKVEPQGTTPASECLFSAPPANSDNGTLAVNPVA